MSQLNLKNHPFRTFSMGLAALFLAACAQITSAPQTKWPEGAGAALSLTYDDALPSHISTALPALDARGLTATFYVTTNAPEFTNHPEVWKQAALDGHELGNHTHEHWCRGPDHASDRAWVTANKDLDNRSLQDLMSDIRTADTALFNLDGKQERSFAYGCGDTHVGGESYIPAIAPRFTAARGTDPALPGTPNLQNLQTFGGHERSAAELIAFVENLKSKGTYGTLMFHGIGADHLVITEEAHSEFLDYLAEDAGDIYIGTVHDIAKHIKEFRAANMR